MNEPAKGESQIPVLKFRRPGGYRHDLNLYATYDVLDGDDGPISKISVKLDLEPCYLRTLIESGEASVQINVSQVTYRATFKGRLDEPFTIALDTSEFTPGGLVTFLPVIVANKNIEMRYVEGEMLPRYAKLRPPFHAKRGFLLGFGRGDTFPVTGKASISSFFVISQIEDPEDHKEPFIVDMNSEQIQIKMMPAEYDGWNRAYNNYALMKDLPIINAAIGYPALNRVMLSLFDGLELYRGKAWYSALMTLLKQKFRQEPESLFLNTLPMKEKIEKAWKYTGVVFDGLLKDAFNSLLEKGRGRHD